MSGWLSGILGDIGVDPNAPPPPDPQAGGLLGLGPVGRSTVDMVSNPDPSFSPLASRERMTPQAAVGALLMRNKTPTVAELPAAEERAQTAVDYGMAVAGATNPIRAYHASPHLFDRFDMSRIGTGEGAQSYGHGLYAAENPAVSGRAGEYDRQFTARTLGKHDLNQAEERVLRLLGEGKGELDILRDMAGNGASFDEASAILDRVMKSKANIYDVALHTEPGRLLDWDAPLAKQPIEARNIANTLERINAGSRLAKPIETGADLYHAMKSAHPARELGYENWSSSGPAQYLKDTGIDGIQYLDQGSRPAAQLIEQLKIDLPKYEARGSKLAVESIRQQLENPPKLTRNYVMFNDKLIEILRRYGIIGAAGGGAAAAAGQGERAD